MGIRVFWAAVLLVGALVSPASGADQESPGEMVRGVVQRVLAMMHDERLDREQRRAGLRDAIGDNFDFEDMSRRILALQWEQATAEERERFVSLLKQRLEQTYLSAIESYTTETVQVGGERIKDNGDATVIVTIVKQNGTDIPLLFKLKYRDDRWLAYDANVEGISLVSHYRDRYKSIIKSEGMPGLLEHMQRSLDAPAGKAQQAAAGS